MPKSTMYNYMYIMYMYFTMYNFRVLLVAYSRTPRIVVWGRVTYQHRA